MITSGLMSDAQIQVWIDALIVKIDTHIVEQSDNLGKREYLVKKKDAWKGIDALVKARLKIHEILRYNKDCILSVDGLFVKQQSKKQVKIQKIFASEKDATEYIDENIDQAAICVLDNLILVAKIL